jgi:hypothetical protein
MLVLEYRVNAMVLSGIDSQRLIMYEKKNRIYPHELFLDELRTTDLRLPHIH